MNTFLTVYLTLSAFAWYGLVRDSLRKNARLSLLDVLGWGVAAMIPAFNVLFGVATIMGVLDRVTVWRRR